MAITIAIPKSYVPGVTERWREQCEFVTVHRLTILTIVGLVAPESLAAATASLDTVAAACALWEQILEKYRVATG